MSCPLFGTAYSKFDNSRYSCYNVILRFFFYVILSMVIL
nr:MAG TPA: hypothetical protein [Caudoviricetes sp.]